MALKYEFDPGKAATNRRKHGVTFEQAISVFEGDKSAYTDYDPEHSAEENRFFTIGYAADGKLLFISHNEEDGLIRIINARHATGGERTLYEDPDS